MSAPALVRSVPAGPATPVAEAAAKYAAKGWHVLPLHAVQAGRCSCGRADCGNPGKHPRLEKGFKQASNDPATVASWWAQWPEANIGLCPGPSGLVVVDLDGPEGEATAEALGLLSEPRLQVTTGRGRHLYFQHPGGHVANAKLGPGIDVRGDGGYVVAPPSVHATGARYQWLGKLEELTPVPSALVPRLHGGPVAVTNGARDQLPAELIPFLEIKEGGRHTNLVRFVGYALHKYRDAAAVQLMAEALNAKFTPPLPAAEVEAVVRGLGAKEAAKGTRPAGAPVEPGTPPADREPHPWMSLADLLRDPSLLVPPRAVVPFLAWEGRLTLLSAREKRGKSTLAGQAVAATVQGLPFLGEPTLHAPGLWLCLDEPLPDLVRRLSESGARTGVLISDMRPSIDELEATITREGCAWFVLDTVADYLGDLRVESFNDAAAVQPHIRELVKLCRRTKVAGVLLHHHNKSGQPADTRQLTASADALIDLDYAADGDQTRRRYTLRGRGLHADLVLGWHPDSGYVIETGEASIDLRVYRAVEAEPGISLKGLRDRVGGANKAIDASLRGFLFRGEIVDRGDAKGHRYFLPRQGEEPRQGVGNPPPVVAEAL